MRKNYIVGIDFGTTYSSIFEFDEAKKMPIGLTGSCSSYFYPTIVAFSHGNWYFGEQALKKNQCILDIKRMFGILQDSPVIENSKKLWETENIVLRKSSKNGLIKIGLKNGVKDSQPDVWMDPDEIASKFIRYLFTDNNLKISEHKKIVVTCPADFNTIQRKVLMKAIERAGFSPDFVTLLNEPSAAALSYFQDTNYENDYNNFLVCDFGGGTFDLTLLNISRKQFTVKSAYGDRYLGGRDFDMAIFEWAKKRFEIKLKRKLKKAEIKQIKNQCQDVKISLNQSPRVSIDILTEDDDEYSEMLTREIFEKLSEPILDKVFKVIDDFLTIQVKLNKKSIEAILLVGGSSNLYIFREKVKQYFGRDPLNYSLPREAIARGACYVAAMNDSYIDSPFNDLNFNQRLSHPIGTDIVSKPGDKRKFSEILHKNDTIPAHGQKKYYSISDNQKSVHIGIYECEELYLDNCVPIYEYNQRVKELPKGKAQITVKMDIDSNGILTATSKFKNLVTNEYDSDYDEEIYRENLNMSDISNYHLKNTDTVIASSGAKYIYEDLKQLVLSNRNPICIITGKPLTEKPEDFEEDPFG
ncbi:Heat shock protein ssb1 [Tritrichomonas musculus]|uniref:Heat shock protein ssb1 n=1 Tax=Tritrichomonas musculus TaxID=1915356 RepID=A0ABR2JWR9_9EUKA